LVFCFCISAASKSSLAIATEIEKNTDDSFKTHEEFIIALEEMNEADFVKKANLTSVDIIRRAYEMLLTKPKYFDRWNEKLKQVESPGFSHPKGRWVLKSSETVREIGFGAKEVVAPKGFESIVDFYDSFKKDTLEVFQKRLSLTQYDLYITWMNVFQSYKADLAYWIDYKGYARIQAGFEVKNSDIKQKQDIDVKQDGSTGFKRKNSDAGLSKAKPIESFGEFQKLISKSNYSELMSRCAVTKAKTLQYWIKILSMTEAKLYKKLMDLWNSRIEIGFMRKNQEPKLIKSTETPPDVQDLTNKNDDIFGHIDCDHLMI